MLHTIEVQSLSHQAVNSKNKQIMASLLLGLMVLSAVGFAPVEVIHNATHDTRHTSVFPCH